MNEQAKKSSGMENGRQMRITSEELSIIRNTFKDKPELLKVLRKIFLPEIEADAPIGGVIDLWMTLQIDNLPPELAMINLKARNQLITHVDQQLMQIKLMSEFEEVDPVKQKEKAKIDSSK